jgi:hypothetical protein
MEIRRIGLKLRYWDQRQLYPAGMLMDHEYEAIKALSGHGVYEMRIDDHIGGHDNIRIVLFDPPKGWLPTPEHVKPLRSVWILEAVQKKRDNWTHAQIQNFRSAVVVLRERCYRS